MEQMPRTPKDAGLIGVALKRKKEYKNSHKEQLIDSEKLFRMLEKLKKSGNKYYQFYDDYTQYQTRCKETDPMGYCVVFHDDVEDDVEKMDAKATEVQDEVLAEKEHVIDDDDNAGEKEDIEYETKDVVKKYQFEYNKSLCMSDK